LKILLNSKKISHCWKRISDSIMKYLRYEVNKRKMEFGLPHLNSKKIPSTKSKKDTVTLLDFIT
jgi:hypothetical protein